VGRSDERSRFIRSSPTEMRQRVCFLDCTSTVSVPVLGLMGASAANELDRCKREFASREEVNFSFNNDPNVPYISACRLRTLYGDSD